MNTHPVTIASPVIAEFCQRHHIVRLALFGSVLRGDFRLDSDIDVLVKFDPAHVPGLFAFMQMSFELEALLGYSIDLLTFDSLHPYIRERVLHDAQVIYESA
jgi:predicted nucleotidyltransferase